MDIRVKRTNAMLVEAFDELIYEKSFDDITVSELCERSTVRRATFYRHFSDMRGFVRYYFSSLADRFMEELGSDSRLRGLVPYATQMHERLLLFADNNKAVFRHVMGAAMLADTLEMMVVQVADGIIARINNEVRLGTICPSSPPEEIGLYYAAGLVHSLRFRILDDGSKDIEATVQAGINILIGMISCPKDQ